MLPFHSVKCSQLILSFFLLFVSLPLLADQPINTLEKGGIFSYEHSGVAIRGADTVAYFTQKKYVPGLDKFSTQWQGATWKFSSQKHLDLFKANPKQYAPQYGGYCAYGVSRNYLVKIEPENWTIVDGKLYLNYDSGVQKKWERDIPGYIKKADANFPELLGG